MPAWERGTRLPSVHRGGEVAQARATSLVRDWRRCCRARARCGRPGAGGRDHRADQEARHRECPPSGCRSQARAVSAVAAQPARREAVRGARGAAQRRERAAQAGPGAAAADGRRAANHLQRGADRVRGSGHPRPGVLARLRGRAARPGAVRWDVRRDHLPLGGGQPRDRPVRHAAEPVHTPSPGPERALRRAAGVRPRHRRVRAIPQRPEVLLRPGHRPLVPHGAGGRCRSGQRRSDGRRQHAPRGQPDAGPTRAVHRLRDRRDARRLRAVHR